jgi:membrane protein implicated in regulation of membrane protease activity
VKVNLPVLFFLLGALLVLLELFFPTFYFFPLGLAFMLSSLFYYFFPSLGGSLAIFSLVTVAGYWFSIKYVKGIKGKESLLRELKGQVGVVIGRLDQFTYEVLFPSVLEGRSSGTLTVKRSSLTVIG